ncbi:MAG: DNA polymerase III subunit alpha [Patescibacteria group bacterium]
MPNNLTELDKTSVMPAILRSFSHFSLLSAIPKIKPLAKALKEAGYAGGALTDEDTGSGLVEFYSACKENEIKPIFGAQLRIESKASAKSSRFKENNGLTKVAILARNEKGRIELNELITQARVDHDQPKAYLPDKVLHSYINPADNANIIINVCGNDNEIFHLAQKKEYAELENMLKNYVEFFGASNIFVELFNVTRTVKAESIQEMNLKLADICNKLSVLYVASPAPRYLAKDDAEAFRAVLGIRDGKRMEDVKLDRDFSLPHLDELKHEFAYLPNAVSNTDLILEKITNTFETKPIADIFPDFILPEGQSADKSLEWEALIGFLFIFASDGLTRAELRKKYPFETTDALRQAISQMEIDSSRLFAYPKDYWQTMSPKDYLNRIDHELGIINTKGYPTYFLVVADFIQFARDTDIVVNTRGSGAGSLVAYLTGITIIDPLLYTIPFERFLNPLRPSTPDIDCDIADDRRDDIIKYVTDKYGAEKVCQIITFGTMLPRMVVRDVGRTLGVSYKKCDRIAKLIPLGKQGSKMTFDKAVEQSQELANVLAQDEDTQKIFAIARKLEGNYRHASVHAAGVIITPTKLTDFTPLQWDSDHVGIVCQLDMNSAEKVGMVKMDFLGIRNLSTLGNTIKAVEKRHKTKVDLTNVNLKSRKAFDLLSKGRTMGIFQLSGGGITRFLIELEPSNVTDLMAMVALYRPGPMANIPEYIKRKRNPKLTEYYVPQMEKWMKSSYGILVYQDDLLYTVIELAGYDWAEADTFRKGVGKKIKAVMDSQHERFVTGCIKHSGLSEETAEYLWSLFVPFAAYGFNKAHAASYGMVSYWTAYMKGEYTVEFMTTLMTEESNNLDKISAAVDECKELGIQVLPPDINYSGDSFEIEADDKIRYGFSSVKNLGSDIIKHIVAERQKNGQFSSLENFLERISNFPTFNKRGLEALIWSGSLDQLGEQVLENLGVWKNSEFKFWSSLAKRYVLTRSFLAGNIERMLEALSAFKHHSQVESDSLFGGGEETTSNGPVIAWEKTQFEILPKPNVLLLEKEFLGIYITGRPLEDFQLLESQLKKLVGTQDLHLAVIDKVKKIFTKSNNLMFALQVTTPESSYEAVIFPKIALEMSPRLEEKKVVWIKGKIDVSKAKKSEEEEVVKKMAEAEDPDLVEENRESDIVEYKDLPKILVDNLNDFREGLSQLFAKSKISQAKIKPLENLDWENLWLEPDKFNPKDLPKLTNHKTEDASVGTKSVEPEEKITANSTNSSDVNFKQKQPDDFVRIIRISMADGENGKLSQIKKLLKPTEADGLIPVKLSVEVSPGEWKSSKVFWLDPNLQIQT